MTERSPSGLWRIFSPSPSSSKPSSPANKPPSGSYPSAPRPPSGSYAPVGGAYTGSSSSITRGLPPEPKGKAEMLLQQAMVNCEHGAWASAETNLRLALTFDPSDAVVKRKLDEVIATRDAERRAANATRR